MRVSLFIALWRNAYSALSLIESHYTMNNRNRPDQVGYEYFKEYFKDITLGFNLYWLNMTGIFFL